MTKSLASRRPLRLDISIAATFAAFLSFFWFCDCIQLNRVAAQEPTLMVDASDVESVLNDEPKQEPVDSVQSPSSIDLLSLITRGGGFMIPIAVMSFLVVTLAAERLLSLRRGKIMPTRLVNQLSVEAEGFEHFHPSVAYENCQKNPSALANVVRAMLLRTGQPLADIERTAGETAQREADQYAAPIRWLNLAAAATPLMGLLGTVWGMIVAFHESTTLTAERSRSEQLSEGIYTALVTTLAGLIVAIPAAIFAQYLENRVAKLFRQIEKFAFELAPALERFEGQKRLRSDGGLYAMQMTPPPPPRGDGSAIASKATKTTASTAKKGNRGGAKTS